jgi:O-antigen/teichoic acid export membrane protein
LNSMSKVSKRIFHLFGSGLYFFTGPLTSLLLASFAALVFYDKEVWGEYVAFTLFTNIAVHIGLFGGKEFYMREFSLYPSQAGRIWRTGFRDRILLILLCAVTWTAFSFSSGLLFPGIIYIFGRFVFLSFDAWFVYKRRALTFAVMEWLAPVVIVVVMLSSGRMWVEGMAYSLAFTEIVKGVIAWTMFSNNIRGANDRIPHSSVLQRALPFFGLSITGMLGSRIDLIFVSLFFSKEDLGNYQVLVGFLLMFQVLANVLLLPIVKMIYRLPTKSVLRLSVKIGVLGVLGAAIFSYALPFIMSRFFHFTMGKDLISPAILFCIPVFFYLPIIYSLYGKKKEIWVLAINVTSIMLTYFLAWIFTDAQGPKLVYILSASALSQVAVGLLFYSVYTREHFTRA